VEPGLREWLITEALEAYQNGEGTLAYAAERAGVSLREMIVAARMRGILPEVESTLLTLEAARQL
jgi:predicted HTH domain antitoxin